MELQEINKALDKAKINLMSRPDSAFFTTICFSLKHTWDETVPTSCTNGKWIRTNPEFFMSLDSEERVFLMLHETLHVAYMHMLRRGNRDPQKWNMAADYVINLVLVDRGFKMPKEGLYDASYRDMSVEQVYDLLPDIPPPPSFHMDISEEDAEGASGEELEGEIQDILVRASLQSQIEGDKPGTIPGDIQIFLNKLLEPKLPWNRILQKYLNTYAKNDYSFRKPNRRFFPRHILPGLKSEKLMDIAVAVDTSGSVTDEEFLQFISEVHTILKMMQPEKITIVQFDTEIKSVDEVRSIKDLKNVKFSGRGGTEIQPVLDWATEKKPKLLLVFTDGYFYFRGTEYIGDTVWLIHGRASYDAPFGKVIIYEAT